MKSKGLLVLMIIMLMSFMLVGCGGGEEAPEGDTAADESWTKIEEKGEFVLGMDEAFPPMGFRDENGELVGFDIDVAKEVCSRLGVELKIQPIDWKVKEQELNTEKIDCIWNGFTITPERLEAHEFTEPYMKNRQVIVLMKDSEVASLEDLEGKKLGYQAGSSAEAALNSHEEFKAGLAEVITFDDNMKLLMDLEKGSLDAVLMDEIVARYNIEANDKGYKVLDEALADEEFGVGFRKGDVALKEKVQETLEAMAEDGTLTEISENWFGKDITTIGK
ncbi:MAG: transporter substrate-binding domain-containing protein [Bacillota bacterium]